MIKNFVVLITFFSFVVIHVSGRTLQKRAAFYIANETACVVDHTVYYNGDPIPTDDPCEACKCRPPGFACVLKECEVKPGCRAVRRAGHCCPEYVCGCEHNGRMYRDGDEIRDSQNPCYTCECQGSSIACAFVDCFFRVDCAPDYVPGECCPRYDHCPQIGSTLKDSLPNVYGHLDIEAHSSTETSVPTTTTSTTTPVPTSASTTTPVPTSASTTTTVPTSTSTTTPVPTTRIQAQEESSTIQEYKGAFEEDTTVPQVPSDVTIKSVDDITSPDRGEKLTKSTINELTEPQDSTTSEEKIPLFYNIDINGFSVIETSHETSSPSSTITNFQQSSVSDRYEKEDKTDAISNSPFSTKTIDKSNDLKFESIEVSNSGVPGEEIQTNRMKLSKNPLSETTQVADDKDSSTTSASVVSKISYSHETNDSPVLVTTDKLIEIYSTKRNDETELPILYNEELPTVSETNTDSSSVAESSSHISTESTEQEGTETMASKENEIKPTIEYAPSSIKTTVLTSLPPLPLIYSTEDDSKNLNTEEKGKNTSDHEQLGEKYTSEISKPESNSLLKNKQISLKISPLEEVLESSETTNETPNESSAQPAVDVTDRNEGENKVKDGNEENSIQNANTTAESSSTYEVVQYHQKGALVSKNSFENEAEISTKVLPTSQISNTDQYSTFPSSDTTSSEIQQNESKNLETNPQISENESEVKPTEDISASNTASSSSDYESTTSSEKSEEKPLHESVTAHSEV